MDLDTQGQTMTFSYHEDEGLIAGIVRLVESWGCRFGSFCAHHVSPRPGAARGAFASERIIHGYHHDPGPGAGPGQTTR